MSLVWVSKKNKTDFIEDIGMKYLIVIAFFILTASAQNELTPEDAIRMGLEKNYTIQIARNNQKIAENDIRKENKIFRRIKGTYPLPVIPIKHLRKVR